MQSCYQIHKSGPSRVILTVSKEQFGSEKWQLRDLMTRTLYMRVANGSLAPWADDLGDAYQVETQTEEQAESLATLLAQWLQDNR